MQSRSAFNLYWGASTRHATHSNPHIAILIGSLGCVQVMEGFFDTVEKIAILLKVRTMAEADPNLEKLWTSRKLMIENDPLKQQTLDDYPTYPTSEDPDVQAFCAAANSQLAMYKGKQGIFARPWIMDSARNMPAHLWWDQNGGSVPELQAFARMVLAQPASASICDPISLHPQRRIAPPRSRPRNPALCIGQEWSQPWEYLRWVSLLIATLPRLSRCAP